ncbi:hypothetical protein C8Q80DRAFT_1119546 [Daedaleopsis nitida]|nr:hypothetical protein C8Q80DRAFT_1119546 [Daedaleopsis nitida]
MSAHAAQSKTCTSMSDSASTAIMEIHEPRMPEQQPPASRPSSGPKPGKDEEAGITVAVAEDVTNGERESTSEERQRQRIGLSALAHVLKTPLGRRVVCVGLLFAASELYPFLGRAILHGRAPEQPRYVAAASAVGAAIVAAVYLVAAVVGRWAAGPGCVLNQTRVVVLAVEVAACLGVGCFAPVLGVAVYHPGLSERGGIGGGGIGAEVLEMLVVSVIGTFVVVLTPVVLLSMVAAGMALWTLKAGTT